MDVKYINDEIDLKLNLLSGDPLYSDEIGIKPLTLREINKIGYSKYMNLIGLLTIDKKLLVGEDPELNKLTLFEIILISGIKDLQDAFIEALSVFLGEVKEDVIINNLGIIFNAKKMDHKKSKIINKDIFHDIVQIIKYQNCITQTNVVYERPVEEDEHTRRIKEKIKKSNQKIEEIKKKQSENDISFYEIVSSVSTKSNTYNKHNVWDLTIYQLYDEYKRLEAISSYEISTMAMVQGAKIDDLKHWSSKFEE
jgi:hypothetical protein